MEIILKKIKDTEEEKRALKEVLLRYWGEIDISFGDKVALIELYLTRVFASNRNLFWICSKNNRFGIVIYYFYNIEKDKRGLHIAEFFIEQEFRRRGIGKNVLSFLRKSFSDVKEYRLEVLKSNVVAYSFWEAAGFCVWKHIMKKK